MMLLGMLRGESGTVAVVVFLDGAPVECLVHFPADRPGLYRDGSDCYQPRPVRDGRAPAAAGAGPGDLARAARACRTRVGSGDGRLFLCHGRQWRRQWHGPT